MIINRTATIAVAVLLVCSVPESATATDRTPPPITECDRLTAHPADPGRVSPEVAFEEIETEKAIAACRKAIEEYPDSERLLFQLGRALDASGKPAEAIGYHEKAAERNYAAAHFSLYLMLTADSAQPEAQAAAGHLERAADLGHVAAQIRLAGALVTGDFGVRDVRRAVALLEPLAEQDNVDAQKYLGALILSEGDEMGRVSDAQRWLERAAEKDDADALLLLAAHYRTGQPFRRDPQKSEDYARRAAASVEPLARKGDARAQLSLGLMHLGGFGAEKNPTRALSLFRQAAEQGLVDAQFQLGQVLLFGMAGQSDDTEAYRWLEKSAVAGYGPARKLLARQYRACLTYDDPTSFFCESREKALTWIRATAEAGDPESAFTLGIVYDEGLTVPQDKEKAREWFDIAEQAGFDVAPALVGRRLELGKVP